MKKLLYTTLFIILINIVAFATYLSLLVVLIRYHIISVGQILVFTDITLSPSAYFLVSIFASMTGYFLAKKWWQAIYVDGVYYFDRSKMLKRQKLTKE